MQLWSLQQRTTSKCYQGPMQWLVDHLPDTVWKWDQGDFFLSINSKFRPPHLYLANPPFVYCKEPGSLFLFVMSITVFSYFFKFGFLFKGSGYSSRSRSGRDKYGPPVRTEYRLIVENLSSRCSWQDLKVHVCSWFMWLFYSSYAQLFLENDVMVFFLFSLSFRTSCARQEK